jgi:HK97 family phage major capsid protein
VNSAGLACPLAFDMDEMRGLHSKVLRGEPGRIEARAFTSASSLLPPQLFAQPLFPIHDNRVMDRWPGMATDSPSVEYIRVDSVGGSAGVTGEGQPKPELTMPATSEIAHVQKIAAHVGVSWESLQDWEAFRAAVTTELTNRVIDVENAELLLGDGSAGHLNGLLGTSGILTHDASGVVGNTTPIDHIEQSIAELRVGSSLAEADLAIFHPSTWSAIRRTKDAQERYLVSADPSVGEVNAIWGVGVLVTTQMTAGLGALVDTTKFGRVLVREPIGLRIGYAGTDFTSNVVRFIAEERIALAVERPSAVIEITGLPAS